MMPVRLDAKISIGSSGAATISNAIGISSVTRSGAGAYKIQLQDNYNSLLSFAVRFTGPASGSDVKIDNSAMTSGQMYKITTLGNATSAKWQAIGVPVGVTPAVGVVFIAASNGGAGNVLTSRVQAVNPSSIVSAQLAGSLEQSSVGGGFLNFQCFAATSSGDTTLIPTDPASGSTMYLEIWLNNSSVQ